MISDDARTIAATRFARVVQSLETTGAPSAPTDLGKRVATRLIGVERKEHIPPPSLTPTQVQVVASRLAALEWRAVLAEVGWGRMRSRRLYRLVNVLAALARRPWRLFALWGDLWAALQPRPAPVLPDPPSPDSYLAELSPPLATTGSKPRPLPYPHLRVAHAGRLAVFEMVAPHLELSSVDLDEELAVGFDMLLVEPGVDDPLEEVTPEVVTKFTDAGIPVLLFARMETHLDYPFAARADLILTEDPDLAERAAGRGLSVFQIAPSVDDSIHNPIGWKHQPDPHLMLLADHAGIGTDLETLAPLADQLTLYGPAIPGLHVSSHIPERPVGADQTATAKNHLAAYTSPQLTATPTSHVQLVLELVASGTPVITRPDPVLDSLLDGHYLPATTTSQIRDHLQTLSHPPTRERHSVPARRHVLTNHTRKHRFEQLLTHLDIPTIPTPRISILLSTKRPENIEHAIGNVTIQNWPNKELLLILHGAENFDLEQITNLTSGLPYPVQIIPCPDNWTLGDCLNYGLDHATGQYVTKMDDDDHYGPNHLLDVHTAHTYSNADITGKWGNIVYSVDLDLTLDWSVTREESVGNHVPGATMFGSASLLRAYRFSRVRRSVDSTLWKRMRHDGRLLYSTHRFNFIRVRAEDHTYVRDIEEFVKHSSGFLRQGLDLTNSMV